MVYIDYKSKFEIYIIFIKKMQILYNIKLEDFKSISVEGRADEADITISNEVIDSDSTVQSSISVEGRADEADITISNELIDSDSTVQSSISVEERADEADITNSNELTDSDSTVQSSISIDNNSNNIFRINKSTKKFFKKKIKLKNIPNSVLINSLVFILYFTR